MSRSIAPGPLADSSKPPVPSNSRFSRLPRLLFSVFMVHPVQAGSAARAAPPPLTTAAMETATTRVAPRALMGRILTGQASPERRVPAGSADAERQLLRARAHRPVEGHRLDAVVAPAAHEDGGGELLP